MSSALSDGDRITESEVVSASRCRRGDGWPLRERRSSWSIVCNGFRCAQQIECFKYSFVSPGLALLRKPYKNSRKVPRSSNRHIDHAAAAYRIMSACAICLYINKYKSLPYTTQRSHGRSVVKSPTTESRVYLEVDATIYRYQWPAQCQK